MKSIVGCHPGESRDPLAYTLSRRTLLRGAATIVGSAAIAQISAPVRSLADAFDDQPERTIESDLRHFELPVDAFHLQRDLLAFLVLRDEIDKLEDPQQRQRIFRAANSLKFLRFGKSNPIIVRASAAASVAIPMSEIELVATLLNRRTDCQLERPTNNAILNAHAAHQVYPRVRYARSVILPISRSDVLSDEAAQEVCESLELSSDCFFLQRDYLPVLTVKREGDTLVALNERRKRGEIHDLDFLASLKRHGDLMASAMRSMRFVRFGKRYVEGQVEKFMHAIEDLGAYRNGLMGGLLDAVSTVAGVFGSDMDKTLEAADGALMSLQDVVQAFQDLADPSIAEKTNVAVLNRERF